MPVRNNSFLFGTLVHQTIEDIHKTVLEGRANEVTNEKIDAWLSENYRQISKAENAYFSESSLKVVRKNIQNYVDYAKDDWQKVKEAEAHAEEDKKRQEEIEIRNNADSLVYTVDKTIEELGDQLAEDKKEDLKNKQKEVQDAIEADNIEQIKEKTEALEKTIHEISAEIYQQAAQAQQAQQQAQAQQDAGNTQSNDDDTIDADFEKQ
jgi:hypothetical protein